MSGENKKTILLVENEALDPISRAKDLENYGYTVIQASSSERAIEKAGKTQCIDLILMDMEPGGGKDGAQAAEQILEKHDLPLVFILSNPDPETLEKVERITSYGFVTRNSSVAEVNSFIKMAFRLFESKKSEKEVRDQLRKKSDLLRFYRLSLDGMDDHRIAVVDREYRYKVVSRQYMISYDLPEEEIVGKTVAELMGDDVFAEFLKPKIDSCLEGNHIQYSEWFDFPVMGKRYMEVSYYPLSFEDQEVSAVAVAVKDITDMKHSEEALRASESKLASILDNVTDVVWSLTYPDMALNYISPSVEQLCGRAPNEFYENPLLWQEVIHPDDQHLAEKNLSDVLEKGSAVRECRVLRPDGNVVWVLDKSKVIYDDNNKPIRIEGIAQDITERKQAEKELIFQNVLMKTQLEVSLDGILIVDENDKIISFNQRFADIWGIPDSIMSLQSSEKALEYVLPKLTNPDEFAKRIHDLYENKQKKSYDEIALTDGKILERYSAPMFGSDDEYYGRIWYYRDITERKQTEEALRRSLKEKNVLLSEIHHRVKNNMAVVSSMLTLQSEFGDQKKDYDELLRNLQTRIMSMSWVHELVYESNDFDQIPSDKLLKRLADYLKSSYQPEGKEISMQVHSDDIMLDMNNSVPMTLFITEVLINAWKHAFTDRRTGQIDLSIKKHEGGIRLVVQDDGIGVPDPDKLKSPESFGYTIIHGLTGTLRGELAFFSPPEGGLKVEAWFPDKTTI